MVGDESKEKFLEEISKTHIVLNACNKTGISRATIYRWCDTDEEFNKKFMTAKSMGRDNMNDASESVIAIGVKNKDFKSAKYFLEHNHPRYMTKQAVEQNRVEDAREGQSGGFRVMEMMEGLKLIYKKYRVKSLAEWLGLKNDDSPPPDQISNPPV